MIGPELMEPSLKLIRATTDLLAARNKLYMSDPESELVPIVDKAIAALLSPIMVVQP